MNETDGLDPDTDWFTELASGEGRAARLQAELRSVLRAATLEVAREAEARNEAERRDQALRADMARMVIAAQQRARAAAEREEAKQRADAARDAPYWAEVAGLGGIEKFRWDQTHSMQAVEHERRFNRLTPFVRFALPGLVAVCFVISVGAASSSSPLVVFFCVFDFVVIALTSGALIWVVWHIVESIRDAIVKGKDYPVGAADIALYLDRRHGVTRQNGADNDSARA